MTDLISTLQSKHPYVTDLEDMQYAIALAETSGLYRAHIVVDRESALLVPVLGIGYSDVNFAKFAVAPKHGGYTPEDEVLTLDLDDWAPMLILLPANHGSTKEFVVVWHFYFNHRSGLEGSFIVSRIGVMHDEVVNGRWEFQFRQDRREITVGWASWGQQGPLAAAEFARALNLATLVQQVLYGREVKKSALA